MNTQSSHAPRGAGSRHGHLPLLLGPDESRVQAASLCPLRPCRTGHHGPKCRVQGRGKKSSCISPWGQAVSVLWRHSRTTLFVSYFTSPSQEKHCQNQGSPRCSPQVVGSRLLVCIMCGKSSTGRVVQGLACFLFLFLFFNSESLHLPAVNPSL